MNFIEELKERKERKENLKEMVLEGIEDEHYKYFITTMLTKCLKDFFDDDEEKKAQENSKCNLHLLIIKNNNNSHLRLIHESNTDKGTWYHRPLKLNLNDNEIEFFINHIIDTFKSYNIEFKKEPHSFYNYLFNQDNKEPIKEFVSRGQIKDLVNLYYQELQKIEYENNDRKSK